MKTIEKELIKFYLDYANNFLTAERMAECYSLPEAGTKQLIQIGRTLHERNVQRIKETKPESQQYYTNLD